jgi:hypothetical protein
MVQNVAIAGNTRYVPLAERDLCGEVRLGKPDLLAATLL